MFSIKDSISYGDVLEVRGMTIIFHVFFRMGRKKNNFTSYN